MSLSGTQARFNVRGPSGVGSVHVLLLWGSLELGHGRLSLAAAPAQSSATVTALWRHDGQAGRGEAPGLAHPRVFLRFASPAVTLRSLPQPYSPSLARGERRG